MDNLIIYQEREIEPKGAVKGILPDAEKIKNFLFDDEYARLELLQTITHFSHIKASFLYPGCGADILFPLLYIERLFPQLQEVHCTFVDTQDNQKLIETVLDDIGIPFSRTKNKISFYWKESVVNISFIVEDIFGIVNSLPAFDIYFERAFRIMKDGHTNYEQTIVQKLNPDGILISDSGFQNTPLKKIDVSKELSVYGEMVMGKKEKIKKKEI
ncbi:MAG: hypothetical protein Q7K45_05425 [Nanoarchaeota archaeon]|nr:hypothetical protein [Nanoarchaeota archaeon]